MYLESLKLHNFRGFEDIEIDFHEKLTVIVGTNGAGKTSILDACSIALSSYLKGLDGYRLIPIESGDARTITFQKGDSFDVQPQYPVQIDATGDILGRRLAWTRNRENNSSTGLAYKGCGTVISMGKLAESKLKDGCDDIIPIIAYYGTGRLWKDTPARPQTKVSFMRQDGYFKCLDSRLDDGMLSEWFEKMTYKDLQNQSKSAAFEAVRAAMEIAFQRITNSNKVTVKTNLDTHKIDVLFMDEKREAHCLSMNQLSDGYRCTLYIIADIAYRMALLNPQLLGKVCQETDGIVLIDEVDLHLHPTWQQRVLGDLQEIFPKVQFIVTTHAPAVINTVAKEHVQILKYGKIYPAPVETYGKDTNGVMTTIMEAAERPEPVKKQFDDFYSALQEKKYELAETVLDILEEEIGEYDPDLTTCRMQLDLAQM